MATNVGTSIPTGWNRDVANMRYLGPNGQIITEMDIMNYGSLGHAIAAKYPITAANPQSIQPITANPFISATNMSVSNTIVVDTDHGKVTINYKTGDLTLPVGMAREDGIREFWMGFQKCFKSADVDRYEKKIKDLEYDAIEYKRLWKESEKITNKKVADKIRTKYNGEKFIMVKPEDLAKFIEDS